MSVCETLAYSKVCAVVCLLCSLIHLSGVTVHQALCWVLEWIPWTWQPLPSWRALCSLYVVYLLWVCTAICCPIDVLIVRTFRQYKYAVGNTTVHISLGTCASFSLSPTVGNRWWILVVLSMLRKILFIVMEVPVGLCTVGLSKWNFQALVAGLFLSLLQHLIAIEAVRLRYLVPSFSSAFTSDGGGNMADFQSPPCLGCSGSYWLCEGRALRGALCIPAGPLHPCSPAEL